MNPRVLLVHHNVTVRALLARRLESAGIETLQAKDAPRGIDVARRHQPVLALIDMTSPIENADDLIDILAGSKDLDVRVCIIADRIDSSSRSEKQRVRRLTRGQVFHPAFSTQLRRRLESKTSH